MQNGTEFVSGLSRQRYRIYRSITDPQGGKTRVEFLKEFPHTMDGLALAQVFLRRLADLKQDHGVFLQHPTITSLGARPRRQTIDMGRNWASDGRAS